MTTWINDDKLSVDDELAYFSLPAGEGIPFTYDGTS